MWKATSPLAVTYTTAVPVPLLGTVRGGTSNPLSKNDYGGEVRSLKCLWYCVNMLLTVIASSNSPISSPPLFVSVAIHTLDRPESEQPLVHHAPAGCVVLTHLCVCVCDWPARILLCISSLTDTTPSMWAPLVQNIVKSTADEARVEKEKNNHSKKKQCTHMQLPVLSVQWLPLGSWGCTYQH